MRMQKSAADVTLHCLHGLLGLFFFLLLALHPVLGYMFDPRYDWFTFDPRGSTTPPRRITLNVLCSGKFPCVVDSAETAFAGKLTMLNPGVCNPGGFGWTWFA